MPGKSQGWIQRMRVVPESTLFLASGMFALGGVLLALDSYARIAAAVAAVPMLALWSILRVQDRQMVELRRQLGNSKEEIFTRRSTMRFIFDELLPGAENLPPAIRHAQHQLEKSLAAAGGFAELLGQSLQGQSLQDPPHSVRQIYLRELRQALQKCTSLNRQFVKSSPGPEQPAPGARVRPGRRDL